MLRVEFEQIADDGFNLVNGVFGSEMNWILMGGEYQWVCWRKRPYQQKIPAT